MDPEAPIFWGIPTMTTMGTPSPAAAEAARLARAEQAMKQFCIDLSGLVGRTLDSVKVDLENLDLVTAEIYSAAVEAGIDIHAVMGAEDDDVATTLEGRAPWMGNCSRVLAKLRRNVPEASYHRILEVWTGSKKDALSDPDAQVCLEYSTFFFAEHDHEVDALVDLGACLLDYAFTRQGLDDELARVTKKQQPSSVRKRLTASMVGYDLRTTPLFDGVSSKLEVHLDIWDDGIWQEVPSLEAADRFAVRALQEHERARALTKPSRQGDATDPGGDYRVVSTMRDSPINKNSTASVRQIIVCKYPTCSKFAVQSYGRYCAYHATVMNAECADPQCKDSATHESRFCAQHYHEYLKGVVKAVSGPDKAEALVAAQTTALAPFEKQREELEMRELTSQTNFGKSLRWLAVVLGGVTAVVTQSLMVLPFVAVAFVMAYAFIDRKAIAAQKERLALKSGEK